MSKGSDLLVAALENEGVERIFGIPGRRTSMWSSRCAPRASSWCSPATSRPPASWPDLRPPHRSAGGCITTLGRARSTSPRAAATPSSAHADGMITGQNGILSSRQARFSDRRPVAAMQPLTKLARQLVSTATIPHAGASNPSASPRRAGRAGWCWSCRKERGRRGRRQGPHRAAAPLSCRSQRRDADRAAAMIAPRSGH